MASRQGIPVLASSAARRAAAALWPALRNSDSRFGEDDSVGMSRVAVGGAQLTPQTGGDSENTRAAFRITGTTCPLLGVQLRTVSSELIFRYQLRTKVWRPSRLKMHRARPFGRLGRGSSGWRREQPTRSATAWQPCARTGVNFANKSSVVLKLGRNQPVIGW